MTLRIALYGVFFLPMHAVTLVHKTPPVMSVLLPGAVSSSGPASVFIIPEVV